jgi:hypothetical protein
MVVFSVDGLSSQLESVLLKTTDVHAGRDVRGEQVGWDLRLLVEGAAPLELPQKRRMPHRKI